MEKSEHVSSSDGDQRADELKRKKRRRRKEGSSSSQDDADEGNSEVEEERRRKRHRRRKFERRRKRDISSSGSESEENGDSDRKSRKRRKKRQKDDSSSSEDEDRRRRRHKREKKAVSEAEKRKAKKDRKEKKKAKLGVGAVTDRYGKYGVIREVDMWNKRPEFGAWLSEVKHINIETLPNREERELFKDFMEDYNTATMPSKKYYNLELHHRNKMAKMHAKGQQLVHAEKVVFDDEEEKRHELQRQRDQQKEAEYQAYKASMAAGLAQDMRDQDRLRNEMQYQYRLGNMEAVDTIKRRLAPEDPSTVP